MANKFIISTDNCADMYKSDLEKLGIYSIALKRILGDKEFAEIYDSKHEYDNFYEDIKKGALPTTSQINPDEFEAHFKRILEKEKSGDIVHISLSSGLSGTHSSAVVAAGALNPTLNGRKIYAFDSMTCSGAQQMLIDKFLELREKTDADTAVKTVENLRDNQQLFFMVDNLHHLKRGGRVSATKAIIGSILGIKPILVVNKNGKLAVVDKTRNNKAANFFVQKLVEGSAVMDDDFADKTIVTLFTVKTDTYSDMFAALETKYPKARLKEVQVGPIIGSHVGGGAFGIVFFGKPRLDVK